MRWSAQPPHLLPLLLFTAVLNLVQHGLNERLPRGVRPFARGRSGRKRRSRRRLTLFLPGSHGTGWSPDYSHLAILRRSRQVRSTIRCRWIALRFAWHRERTGADRCRATAREPLSIRVRRRVRPSPSDAFADLKRRAPVARPIRAGGCPVRGPCRAGLPEVRAVEGLPRGVRPFARGRSADESAGAGGALRCSFRGVPRHGVRAPDYRPLAPPGCCPILRRSRQVRSTIRCRWIALRFAWHRERTGADRCRATAREPLSIRVRRRVRPAPQTGNGRLRGAVATRFRQVALGQTDRAVVLAGRRRMHLRT